MRFRHVYVLSLVALAIVLCARAGGATTILPAEFGEMVAGSPLIVHGTVVAVRAQTTAGRRSIESLVTVDVIQPLKGPSTAQVVFRVPNGQIGRYRRMTVGAPEFRSGDEVVLFLDGRPPVVPMPFGLNQGVYRVNRSSGRALVTPVLTPGAGRVVRGDPARRPLTVADFARHVRAVAGSR
jgi:hypothetical protein